MSVAVGLVDRGTVYIGTDSIGMDDEAFEARRDAKAWERGGMLFAGTGCFRVMQVLRCGLEPPKIKRGQDPFCYLVTTFAEHLRATLSAAGYEPKQAAKDEDDTSLLGDCNLLVGLRGRLFRIDSDLSIAEVTAGFDSIGIGKSFAIGALWQQESDAAKARRYKREAPLSPRERIFEALSAADRASHKVCKPFIILPAERKSATT